MVTPGPGNYDIRVSTSHSVSTKFSKAKRNLNSTGKSSSPGPGYYPLKHFVSGKNGFSLGPKIDTEKHNNGVPGPDTYNVAFSPFKSTSRTISFPKKKRSTFVEMEEIPGPGEYKPELMKTSPVFSFGAKYNDVGDKSEKPGPSTYFREGATEMKIKGPKYTMQNREALVKKVNRFDEMPGPGTHDPDLDSVIKPVFILNNLREWLLVLVRVYVMIRRSIQKDQGRSIMWRRKLAKGRERSLRSQLLI